MVKKFFLNYYPFLIFFALILIFFFRELWPQKEMLSFNDRLPFAPSWQVGKNFFQDFWHEQVPGIQLFPIGGGIVLFFENILTFLFFNKAIFAQKISFLIPLIIAFFSMYWVLGQLNIKSNFAKLLGSLIFAFNLPVFGELRGGSPATLAASAFLPLVFFYLYRIFWLKESKLSDYILFGIFFFLSFTFSDHIIFFFLLFCFVFFLLEIFQKEKGSLLNFFKKFLGLLLIIILFNSFYIFIYFSLAKKSLSSPEHSMAISQMLVDVFSSYSKFNISHLFTLGNGQFYENIFGGKNWSLALWLLPLLVLLGIFSKLKNDKFPKTFFILIILLIALFYFAIKWQLLDFAFKAFPLLFRFRNAARTNILLSLAYGFLAAYGIDYLILKSKKTFVSFLIFLILPLYLISIWPIFFGGILSRKNQKAKTVPKYYQEITQFINEDRIKTGNYRSFWFPWNYQVQKNILYSDSMPSGLLLGYGQYTQSGYLNTLEEIYSLAENQKISQFEKALEFLNVKYIVIDLNENDNQKDLKGGSVFLTPTLTGDPKKFKGFADKLNDYKKVIEKNEFIIYLNEKMKGGEIKIADNLNDYYFNNPKNYLDILLDNEVNLENAFLINEIKGNEDLKNFHRISSNKEIIKEDFSGSFINENLWEIENWQDKKINKGRLVLDENHSGIRLKRAVREGMIIDFNLKLNNFKDYAPANINITDSGKNGFVLDFVRQTNTNDPIIIFGLRDHDDIFSKEVSRWDTQKHEYKLVWQNEKIQFLIDNQIVAEKEFKLKNDLTFSIYNHPKQEIEMDKFEISKTNDDFALIPDTLKEASLKKVDFSKKDEYTYNLNLDKVAGQYLILNRPYDKRWVAETTGKTIPAFEINGWASGFDLKDLKEKNQEIKIFYQPNSQRIFWFYLNIAVIFLAISGLFLIKRIYPERAKRVEG